MCLIKKGEQKKRVAANPSPTSKHLPPPHSGNHMDANARTLPPTRLSGWQQSLGVRVEPTHPTWVRRVDFPFASVLAKAHNLFRPPNITARPSPTTPKHPPNSPLAGDLRHCRLFHAGKKRLKLGHEPWDRHFGIMVATWCEVRKTTRPVAAELFLIARWGQWD